MSDEVFAPGGSKSLWAWEDNPLWLTAACGTAAFTASLLAIIWAGSRL